MTRIRRILSVVTAGVAAILLLLIVATAAERVLWRGKVLPGVELIGASVSGQSTARTAEEIAGVGARLEGDVLVARAADVELRLDPRRIDLQVDEDTTIESVQDAGRAGNVFGQVAGTILRLARADEVTWSVSYDEDALAGVLDEWAGEVATTAVDGGLRFEGTEVVPVEPELGRVLDRPAADRIVETALHEGHRGVLRLPVREERPAVTRAEVARAAAEARSLLTAPVMVHVENVTIRLEPEQIASALRTEVDGRRLRLALDHETLKGHLGPDAHALEREPEDARLAVEGGRVSVVPHQVGRTLDVEGIAEGILSGEAIVKGGLTEQEPEETTAELEALKVTELVSSFTTHYPAGQPRVTNIQRAAELVNDTIIRAGQAFSLNEAIGRRTPDRGFVSAPVIYGGEYTEDIGGGTSQFATTFFNAIFFGGYPINEYQAHTYYIDRYPMGRESTISWPKPDVRFHNDTDAAILVRSYAGATSVTVNFYSTETRQVSAEGPTVVENLPAPEQIVVDGTVPRGQRKVRESGSDGFVVRVVRVVKGLDGEEQDRRTFTTRYRPQTRVVAVHPCDHPDPAKRPPPEQCEQPPPPEPPPEEPPPPEGEPPPPPE